jgi:parallel beta-helix repeat protein
VKKNLLLALSSLASLAISAFIHPAHAQTTPTTLYVSVTGNDSTGTGSSAAPYQTLRKAAQKSVLGGIIYIKPGVYNVGANSGSLNKWHYEVELNATEAGKLTATPTFCDGYDPAKMLTVTVDPAISGSVIFRMDSSYSSGSQGTRLLGIRSGCVAFDGANRTLIDGNNVPVNSTSGILFMNGLRNVIFKNSELQWSTLPLSNRVANSSNTRPVYVSGTGISFSGMTNLKIQNNKIHHFDGSSIYGHGNNVLIENNDIHHVVLENANNWYIKTLLSDGGWAGTLNIVPEWVNGTRAQSSNIVIRNNLVHESWGEGIIAGFIGGEVSGNTVYDTYANGIYLNGSKDIAVLRNYIYTTDNTYDKCYGSTYPTTSLRNTCLHLYAFSIAMEYSSTTPSITAENLTIDNNLAVRVERGINYWKDPANLNANNTYRNLKIRHNTFVDVREKSAVIYELCSPACSTLWSGNEFKNNIFIYAPRTPALTQLNFPNDELWTISNNLVSASISDAGFAGPTFTPGAAVGNFTLAATAPIVVSRGGVASSESADYFGNTRNANYPSLGMHESSTTASPPPPPPPVVLGPNLLNNGGFEAGNFSSWSNVVAGIYPDSADHTTNSMYAAHFTVSNVEIAQGFLAVTARANYVLSASFKCKALSGTGSGFPRLMVYGKEPGGTTWRVVATSDQATMLAYCGGSKVGTWQSVKVPFVAQWRDSASGITYDINQILVRAGSVNTKQTTDFLFDDVSLNLRY